MDWNEERYCRVSSLVLGMPKSEGRTSEASMITATYDDTRMEVGQAWHGFHHRIAQDPIGI